VSVSCVVCAGSIHRAEECGIESSAFVFKMQFVALRWGLIQGSFCTAESGFNS
jgi:hypothetical protein